MVTAVQTLVVNKLIHELFTSWHPHTKKAALYLFQVVVGAEAFLTPQPTGPPATCI